MTECVVFHAPYGMHILFDDTPADLVRFECFAPCAFRALLLCDRLAAKYAPMAPSGQPEMVYHYCTVSQWEEWVNKHSQLTLF